MALVIAALVGAIGLAVLSPTEPGGATTQGLAPVGSTPSPSPEITDTRVPAARPAITRPTSGVVTGEWEIEVAVEIPEEALARRHLTLVILRDGTEIGELERPRTGGTDAVPGARLVPGPNEISAALKGPGGLLGPASDPVLVTLDRDKPGLQLTSPRNRTKTFDDTVIVEGTSEPGAEVSISNAAQGYDPEPFVVGPSGTFQVTVPLAKGRNEIIARSVDEAAQTREEGIVVTRKDGKPVIKLIVPDQIERSKLPGKVRFVVEVTDSAGDKMEGAVVSWTMGGDNRLAETYEDETRPNGRSTWSPEVRAGSSLLVGVEVTSPYGQTRSSSREVPLR